LRPTTALGDSHRPRWEQLPTTLQLALLAPLTRMLQQQLPAGDATAAKEVADEAR
jgi:hypothetical protein